MNKYPNPAARPQGEPSAMALAVRKAKREVLTAERTKPQGEPVAELVALDDGLGTVIAQWNEERRARLPVGAKFYTHPDPRVAVLEGLLRECVDLSAVELDGGLRRRIRAALGAGES